jgi:hypothetical protein
MRVATLQRIILRIAFTGLSERVKNLKIALTTRTDCPALAVNMKL